MVDQVNVYLSDTQIPDFFGIYALIAEEAGVERLRDDDHLFAASLCSHFEVLIVLI